jgi:hypothetical protein
MSGLGVYERRSKEWQLWVVEVHHGVAAVAEAFGRS